MKRIVCHFLLFAVCVSLAGVLPAGGQSLENDLAVLVRTPAVVGNEQALAGEIESRIVKWKPQRDNLGNVYATLGSGMPHRLIVTPMDEPGYVVSAITDDGFLRVQRLPQGAPHGLFDQLHAAQAVWIATRSGKLVTGIVAGLSTHLQGGRRDAPRVNHPDEIFIDIGAASTTEVRQAGVDLLDPIALEREVLSMAFGKRTAPAIGDRFGAAALVELLRRVDPAKVNGTLTVAFVAQQWAGSRGLDRLMQHVKADEMIYVGRLLPRRGGFGATAQQQERERAPTKPVGSGVLIGTANPDGALSGFADELRLLAEQNRIPVAADFSAPLPRVSYTQGPVPPQRFAHLGVATAWPVTPAETLQSNDVYWTVELLEGYVHGGYQPKPAPGEGGSQARAASPAKPQTAPPMTQLLKELVEAYGVSGQEGPVREVVSRLLPAWARPETDEIGNLILRLAKRPAGSKAPRIVFVAHSDEIGYEVRSIASDGRLVVASRGGGIIEFFAGHAMLVHTAGGTKAGVMELPEGWDRADFQWPRGQQMVLRIDVGARNPEEVAQLGIKVGDTATVPKKYRPLNATRANGRSFDDRVGSAALVAAAWALGPELRDRDVTLIWATQEEVGLRGAFAAANRMAAAGEAPDYVFAVDTFVSSDSPLESKRFADAKIGAGFVIRAVDNSNIVRRDLVDRLVELARRNNIPVQYGVTGGGNDGAVFLRQGTIDIPISWPLRYSHSPGEVIDTRDAEALARIVEVIARSW